MSTMTLAEASKRSPLTEPQLRRLLRQGRLTPIRPVEGGRIFIDVEELRRLLGPLLKTV